MIPLSLYTLAGASLFFIGLWGVVARAHLLWKVLGINIMGSGVFLILLSASPRLDPEVADPVPQAMVLTGIVVAVAATAVALGMALRVTARTGAPYLQEEAGPGKDDPHRADG
jgi:multicomponent Na+:H+ antiporter subunit C